MVSSLAFNPILTTNGAGSFNTESVGYIQGQAMDDPSARYRLAGGILSTAETLPMWGGVGITELTAPQSAGATSVLGGNIKRALQIAAGNTQLTGFSVFDQNHSAINTPQSPVPLVLSGMTLNFYRFGSNARIALAIDPALVDLEGNAITQNVSWDFVGQRLVSYAPAYAAVTISGATWASTAGGQTTFTVGTDLTAVLTAGDIINVSGVVSTGGTGAGYNGAFPVVSVGDSTHVTVAQASASSPGTYSSGGTIAAAGGAVPVTILNVQVGNSMTVSYDPTTGFATWNRSGSCALVQL